MSNVEVKSDGNPTNQNGDPMKQVYMGNNKSLVDSEVLYWLCLFESPSLWCRQSVFYID